MPADEHSPGAPEAGAAEYIDLLSARITGLALIFRRRAGMAGPPIGEALSGSLSPQPIPGSRRDCWNYSLSEEQSAELKSGMVFFDWARRMTVDAFYTSPTASKTSVTWATKA